MLGARERVVVYLITLIPVVYVVSKPDELPFWIGIAAWVSSWMLVFLILDVFMEVWGRK